MADKSKCVELKSIKVKGQCIHMIAIPDTIFHNKFKFECTSGRVTTPESLSTIPTNKIPNKTLHKVWGATSDQTT
jgi:hypothetical protein